MDDDAFELSQAHLMFYDKLEKARVFLTRVHELREHGDNDRELLHILGDPISDGGTWHAFVELVQRYGVVPASAMPETSPSTDSYALNRLLRTLLLQAAERIRSDVTADDEHIENIIEEIMRRVKRLLCICLGGPPPETFTWTYKIKEPEEVVTKKEMTPLELLAACNVNLRDFVVLTHTPSRDKKEGQAYHIHYLDSVHDPAERSLFYNVSLEDMKKATRACLEAGTAVYFSSEFDFMRLTGDGLLHHELVNYHRAIGEDLATRSDRVNARSVAVDHAMLFTGFHATSDTVDRWQVENSHGDEFAKGYLSMSDGWFDRHVFDVAVPKDFVDLKLDTFQKIPLPPWDVIGAVLVR